MYTILQPQDARAALQAASEHVRLVEPILKSHPDAVNLLHQMAVAYIQVATLQIDINVAEGIRYFELSLKMRESLRERDPKNGAVLRGLSVAYGNYASTLGSPSRQ